MDPIALATIAINLLGPYLARAGDAAAQKLGDSAAKHVGDMLETIRAKFAADDDTYAGQTLARVEQQPDAEPRRQALAGIVAEKMDADPAFKKRLEELVREADRDPSTHQFLVQVSGGSVGDIVQIGTATNVEIGSNRPRER